MTAAECVNVVKTRLAAAGIESNDYESRIFLEWLAGIDWADYFMNPNKELLPEQWEKIDTMVKRREAREPLQYLMGSCDFMGYEFYVDERVLIPRQDTECLLELAIETAREEIKDRNKEIPGLGEKTKPYRILDLCTGSGCIGISMKKFCPSADVTLSDLSVGALEVAKQNAKSLEVDVHMVQGDLFEHVEGAFDMILSNPPYIPTEVCKGLMPEVKDHEPMLALDGEADGLLFYRRIIRDAAAYLTAKGHLMFEIGSDQGEAVSGLMCAAGFVEVEVKKDLAGLDRIVCGRLAGLES